MALYYSTFIPGLLEPVSAALQAALPQCRIKLGLDGLVVYESSAKVADLQRLPFVTNSFLVLKMFPGNTKRGIEELADQVLRDRSLEVRLPASSSRRPVTFRVITSVASQLVPLSPAKMHALEERVSQQTGARSHRAKPDTELWLLQRTEGHGFFSVRLSQHKSFDTVLDKGELRPDVAWLLCQLSQPKAGELFLDPFCGSGAIPLQRAQFPTGLIFASDSDCTRVDRFKERLREAGLKKKIVARCEDALHLHRYDAGSIHAIVTDPPWGMFESLKMPVEAFYEGMTAELTRLLRPGGTLVLLTAQKEIFAACIAKRTAELLPRATYNILVSGKKASVFVLTRNEQQLANEADAPPSTSSVHPPA